MLLSPSSSERGDFSYSIYIFFKNLFCLCKGVGSLGIVNIDRCELPCKRWELNQGTLNR